MQKRDEVRESISEETLLGSLKSRSKGQNRCLHTCEISVTMTYNKGNVSINGLVSYLDYLKGLTVNGKSSDFFLSF